MKFVAIGLAAFLALIVVVGLALPSAYHVEESTVIDAPPAEVHAWLDDLERWKQWGPWHDDDPSIVVTYGPATKGVGASQSWTGKDGDGELTITRSDVANGVGYDMVFIMGESRVPSSATMDIEPAGEGTRVVWQMDGDTADFMPPVARGYMGYFMPGSIGDMFQRGLANLKRVVEAR